MAKPRLFTPEQVRSLREWWATTPRESVSSKARKVGVRPQSLIPLLRGQTYKEVKP